MLKKFKQAKEPEIAILNQLDAQGKLPPPWPGPRPLFSRAITQGSGGIIAEYKRGSPSKGPINLKLSPAQAAKMYKAGGARAMSVLTEEKYFFSKIEFLTECFPAGLPLLRKDFIFHPLQIRHTAAYPASALLLIMRYFLQDHKLLDQLLQLSQNLGLECVVEVFDLDELHLAKESKAKIIQVNNRNLQTLEVDLDISRQLINFKDPGEIWICASGINSPAEVQEMTSLGFEGCLIGTSLMAAPDPLAKLRSLTGKTSLE